jgi:hypothetical protein
MAISNTNLFHCKTFQNLPKLGFLVGKQTIWQYWSQVGPTFSEMKYVKRTFGCKQILLSANPSFMYDLNRMMPKHSRVENGEEIRRISSWDRCYDF